MKKYWLRSSLGACAFVLAVAAQPSFANNCQYEVAGDDDGSHITVGLVPDAENYVFVAVGKPQWTMREGEEVGSISLVADYARTSGITPDEPRHIEGDGKVLGGAVVIFLSVEEWQIFARAATDRVIVSREGKPIAIFDMQSRGWLGGLVSFKNCLYDLREERERQKEKQFEEDIPVDPFE